MPRDRETRVPDSTELPFQVGPGMKDRPSGKHGVRDSNPGTWGTVVRAAQGNFDHLMGVVRRLVAGHNSLVDDVSDLKTFVEDGLDNSPDIEHVHDGSGDGGGTVSHDVLSDVSANDHHAQSHDSTDHDTAEAGDLAAVALAAAAGSGAEVPTAGHVHPHGSGYAGGHTDSLVDHGALTGLADDDHPQYLTEAEGDAAYADITEPIAVAHRDDTTDVHDHGQLAGLADDDHTQYVKHSIADAVGDILVASGDNVFTRLAKGTQGQVLTVDTGEALDLKYADAAGGGGPSIFVWSSKVHLTNGSASRRIYVAEDMTISYCYVSLGVANTGSCIVDVHKNGTTIYTTQANRPTVTAAFVSDHEVPDVTALAAGAYLECIIDQVGAGTQGRVQVYIVATYD